MAKRSRKHPLRRLAVLAALLLALVLFARWENTSLEVDCFDPAFSALPAGFDGCRIVVLSDLHGAEFGEDNTDLFETVAEQAPEYIFYLGDLEDKYRGPEPGYAETVAAGFPPLPPPTTSPATTSGPSVTCRAEGAAGRPGRHRPLQQHCDAGAERGHVVLAGIDDPNGYADQKTRYGGGGGLRRLRRPLLDAAAHRNDHFEAQYSLLGADLVLSGPRPRRHHPPPFTDGLLSTDRPLFPSYTAGLYEANARPVVTRAWATPVPPSGCSTGRKWRW
jgi:hypothetical protein